MTRGRRLALLAGPLLLLASAWALGGAVFTQSGADLGGLIVVNATDGRPSTPAGARPIGPSPQPDDEVTAGPSPSPQTAPSVSTAVPGPEPTQEAPSGAVRVTSAPVPTAGDDDDRDDADLRDDDMDDDAADDADDSDDADDADDADVGDDDTDN